MWRNAAFFIYYAPVLAFSAPADGDYALTDATYALVDDAYDMGFGEFLPEWDQMEEMYWPMSFCEWQDDEKTDAGHERAEPEQMGEPRPAKGHCHVKDGGDAGSKVVIFARPKTPKKFIECWPEQRRLFQSLQHPLSAEHYSEVRRAYYPLTAAGQLLDELGEQAFLDKFGKGTVSQMKLASLTEIRQRRAAERELEVAEAEAVGGPEKERILLGAAAFVRPKSPKGFVKRWPEQKRLFESLPYPRTPEQLRALWSAYYPFTAAGQLLEELAEKEFLQKFGQDTVAQMQRATMAVMKQRRAAEKRKDQRMAGGVGDVDNDVPRAVAFARPKSPKDFAKRWSEQKRLFQSLPYPRTPEQTRILRQAYYPSAVAGQLLDELGVENFLQKFGKGTVAQMQKAAVAEMKQRKEAEEEQGAGIGEDADSEVVKFVRPKAPKDFIMLWPKQKCLYESLAHPRSRAQNLELQGTFYKFAMAGQLLDELGEKEFLKKFGQGSVALMRKTAIAEMKKRKAAEEDQRVTEGVESADGSGSRIVVFAKPKSPKDFAARWLEQKRTFESLPYPLSPEQYRELQRTYYRTAPAGQLLEELGKKEFLQRFGKGTVTQMRSAVRSEMKQRKAIKIDLDVESADADVDGKEGAAGSGIVVFVKPKSPKSFVKRWPEKKRLFESLPLSRTPEQARELVRAYYPFTTAGQLLEELGEEEFLQRFGGGSMTQMLKATRIEMQQRRATKKGGRPKGGGCIAKGSAKVKDRSRTRSDDKMNKRSNSLSSEGLKGVT